MVKKIKRENNAKTYFFLFLIVLVSMILRLYQPDWYNDRQFHPDERWIISNAVPPIKYWGDKPIGLQYGSLPIYILHIQRSIVFWINSHWQIRDMNAATIGGARVLSGLVDTGTIIFIFFTAFLLFGSGVALLAAFLLGFTVLHIHASHFYTVDTFVTFFIAGCVYFSARIYKYGNIKDYILSGVFLGAALASKTAALPVIFVILTAHLLYFFSIKGNTKKAKEEKVQSWLNFGTAITVTLIAFFIFMPHAILSFQQFMRDQNYQKSILVTGEGDVPYNRQYLKTTPYLYYIKNLVLYTMGIPYGTVAFFAFAFYLILFFKKLKDGKLIDAGILLILSFAFPYFLIVGASFAKFNRYMLPFTPFLAILTAKFIYDFYNLSNRKIALALKYLVVLSVIFYGFAFMNVYFNSHTWIQASRWIYKNIPEINNSKTPPQRTTILNEMWGDDLPVYADGKHIGIYNNLKWNLQEPDSPRKIDELSNALSQSDYVMMADKRAYGTYQRIPERYPINYFYYKTMLNEPEKLGFKKVYECAVYPSFLGITIKDDNADESFQLYDHPHVYIFKNELYLSSQQLKELIINGEKAVREKFQTKKGQGNPNLGETKDKVKAILPSISVFLWYLLVQLLAFIVFPLHYFLLKNLNDKGYGLAKVSGILIFAFVNWILVSLNIIKFYQINLWILLLIFAGISIFYYYKNMANYFEFFNKNKKYILLTEIIFLSCYMFFIFVKLNCPDIHNIQGQGYNGGGEPMGMAYLSGIFNDVKFPPHDPWLSGFTLNYYYWGQLMLATITKLLGYMPAVTYNLSLSLLFALCFLSAFSLTYNMTGKYKYALLGGTLLGLAGNFHTLNFIYDAIINSAGNLNRMLDGIFRFQFIWDPTRIYPSPVITEVPFFSYLYGDLHAHNIVIPVTVLAIAFLYNAVKTENKTLNILNSFGNNLAEMTLNILLISLLLGIMLPMNTWNFPPQLILTVLTVFLISYFIYKNTSGKKLKAAEHIKKITTLFINFLIMSIVIAITAYILFLPFHLNFVSPYKAIPRLISKMERVSVFVMFKYFSIFFFIVFAYIIFNINKGWGAFAKKTGFLKINWFNFEKIEKNVSKIFDKIFYDNKISLIFIITTITILLAILIGWLIQPTFGIIFLMAVVCLWQLIKTNDRTEAFSLLLVLICFGIIIGTEIYFLGDGRMNTVFKFYMVAWTFLAVALPYLFYKIINETKKYLLLNKKEIRFDLLYIAAGTFLLLLAIYLLQSLDMKNGTSYMQSLYIIIIIFGTVFLYILKDRIGKIIYWSSFIFVFIPVILYPFMSSFTKMKLCSNNFTQELRIDGIKYIEKMEKRPGAVYDFDKYDYGAINWINENLKTIETIVEAPGDRMYTGLSRISIFTGMPTIVGWGYQVGQQSGRGDKVQEGFMLTNRIYTDKDAEATKNILKEKNIKYVYIGSIEKALYPEAVEKFNQIATPVYQNEGAVLFKLNEN
jgi:YYY domain-containing protein